jgi:hypothetical protein
VVVIVLHQATQFATAVSRFLARFTFMKRRIDMAMASVKIGCTISNRGPCGDKKPRSKVNMHASECQFIWLPFRVIIALVLSILASFL